MATIHNQLTRGPWTSTVKAILGFTKSDGGIERFGETMQPVLDLWTRPEFAFLRRERLEAGTVDVTSAAGTIPEGLLFNPPNSRIVGVVTMLRFVQITTLGNLFTYRLLRAGVLPAGFVAVNSGPLDTRDPTLIAAPAAGLILAQAANAAVAGGLAFDQRLSAVNIEVIDTQPIVLGPGTGFVFGGVTVGVQRFVAGVRWYERTAFPGELP